MSHIYRCMSCRTRNTFARARHDYVRGRKCRHCGHTRFYVDRERIGRRGCGCGGYHFPHRPGSPCCESNPMADANRAKRAGESPELVADLAMEAALFGKLARAEACPF